MANPGQPTLYKPGYCELAHNHCLLGATNKTLAGFFGVTRRTIQNWIATRSKIRKGAERSETPRAGPGPPGVHPDWVCSLLGARHSSGAHAVYATRKDAQL